MSGVCTYDARGRLRVGSGLHGGCCCQGTILVVSTASHDLREYWVYTTDGVSTMAPQFHDWHYEGTVSELFRDAPKKPNKRNLERLLGVASEYYCMRNYGGTVSMYVRLTNQVPTNTYVLYELRDVYDRIDWWSSSSVRSRGRRPMPGWN